MKKLPDTETFRISKRLLKRIRRIVLMAQLDGEQVTIRSWIEDAIECKLPKLGDK